MRDEFDSITNDGKDYDPEKHDNQVFKKAAERFRISEVDAGNYF